ncbi:hypothetical protein G6F62_001318 [Rhizopus arrhizus]|nr:hypothetical protein G6F62_001318 [Rhizopus arrhizus]
MFTTRTFPAWTRAMSTLTRIKTKKAPAAIGPYAQAIKVNKMVYTSGSIPIVPETGEISQGIKEQTKQVLLNMSNVLEASGSSLDKVVKTTVFLKDMNDFNSMNEVYSSFFDKHQPARSAVEVARLPKDVSVEIECIATLGLHQQQRAQTQQSIIFERHENKKARMTSNHPRIEVKTSLSTPLKKHTIDPQERVQFLKEMEKTRKEFKELKKNMNQLMEEMDSLSLKLKTSKERVFEIEQDLTTREEVNVDLQVVLENAIQTQKESDTCAQQTIRNAYARLVSVIHDNNRLQGKVSTLEDDQKRQQGRVDDITKRMQEYTKMLEQAQGTIRLLQKSSENEDPWMI